MLDIVVLIFFYSKLYGIDKEVAVKIPAVESSFLYWNKSDKGAIGLYGVTKEALLDYNKKNNTSYELSDLYNPEVNIKIGMWYFSYMKEIAKRRNKEDIYKWALTYYFWGAWNDNNTFTYANKVLKYN